MELFVELVLDIVFIFKIELTDLLLRAYSYLFIYCVLRCACTMLITKVAEIEQLFVAGTVLLGI